MRMTRAMFVFATTMALALAMVVAASAATTTPGQSYPSDAAQPAQANGAVVSGTALLTGKPEWLQQEAAQLSVSVR